MVVSISYQIDAKLVTKRAHGQIMREINRGMLERWQNRYLPLHFKGEASERYGYKPRGARYVASKRRRVGHNIPLVYTGKLKTAIQSGVVIRATQYRATLKTKGYFPMREEMRSEIERITQAERDELVQWAGKEYLKLAKRPDTTDNDDESERAHRWLLM